MLETMRSIDTGAAASAAAAIDEKAKHLEYVMEKLEGAITSVVASKAAAGLSASGKARNTLWKHGGHPTVPATAALHSCQQRLDDLAGAHRVFPRRTSLSTDHTSVTLGQLLAEAHPALNYSATAARDVTRASCHFRYAGQVAESQSAVMEQVPTMLVKQAAARNARLRTLYNTSRVALGAAVNDRDEDTTDVGGEGGDREEETKHRESTADNLESHLGALGGDVVLWTNPSSGDVTEVLERWIDIQLAPLSEEAALRAEVALVADLLEARRLLAARLAAATAGEKQLSDGGCVAVLRRAAADLAELLNTGTSRVGGHTIATDLSPHQQLLWTLNHYLDEAATKGDEPSPDLLYKVTSCIKEAMAELVSTCYSRMWAVPLACAHLVSPQVSLRDEDADPHLSQSAGGARGGGPNAVMDGNGVGTALRLLRCGGIGVTEQIWRTEMCTGTSLRSRGMLAVPVRGSSAVAVHDRRGKAMQLAKLHLALVEVARGRQSRTPVIGSSGLTSSSIITTADDEFLGHMLRTQVLLLDDTLRVHARYFATADSKVLQSVLDQALSELGASPAGEGQARDGDSVCATVTPDVVGALEQVLKRTTDSRFGAALQSLVLPCVRGRAFATWWAVARGSGDGSV